MFSKRPDRVGSPGMKERVASASAHTSISNPNAFVFSFKLMFSFAFVLNILFPFPLLTLHHLIFEMLSYVASLSPTTACNL